jgi:syntaxin 1B/2/3
MTTLENINVNLEELNNIKLTSKEKQDNINNIKKQIKDYLQNQYVTTFDNITNILEIIKSLNIKLIDDDDDENQELNNSNNNNIIQSQEQIKYTQQLLNKNEYLEKREKDLRKIQETAAKINALSNTIKVKVYEQGKQIDTIQDHVEEADKNIDLAQFEIEKAKKIEKGNKKKLCCIIFWAVFIVCAIITLFIVILKK